MSHATSAANHRGGRGADGAFTLVELLVVVAIIGLLVSLLAAPVSSARRQAKTAICQSRLHQIGDAYQARAGDELAGEVTTFRPLGWMSALLPYLSGQTTVLACPEAGDFVAVPVEEQLEVREYCHAFDCTLRLDGPLSAKMSDSQYQALKSAGYMHHGKALSNYSSYSGYLPDNQTNVVWFCIEEVLPRYEGVGGMQSGNAARDYEDVRMRVTDNEDGTFDLYFELGSGEVDTDIVRGESTDVLCTIPKGYPRQPMAAGPFEGSLSHSTYGMNVATSSYRASPGKVLVLDYERSIARPTDLWSDDKMDPDGDGLPVFARHRGRLNVLFGDLSVRKVRPADIDPVLPSVAGEYWEISGSD